MIFEKLLHTLFPTMEKSKIVDDCRTTIDELKTTTIPAYDQAVILFKAFKYKSPEYTDFTATFQRMSKAGKGPLVNTIAAASKNVLANMEIVLSLVDDVFEADVEAKGLTFRKANVLQIMSTSAFFSRYARKWLMYLYILETAEFDDGGVTSVKDCLAPAEIEWLNNNFVNFLSVMNVLGQSAQNNYKKLLEIPEIVVTPENSKTMVSQFGEKVDPLAMRFVPVVMNPWYLWGMWRAEVQVKRYNAAKEEMRALQLRRMNLEKILEGKPDAKLQKEIEYIESRINKLNYELEELENKHA